MNLIVTVDSANNINEVEEKNNDLPLTFACNAPTLTEDLAITNVTFLRESPSSPWVYFKYTFKNLGTGNIVHSTQDVHFIITKIGTNTPLADDVRSYVLAPGEESYRYSYTTNFINPCAGVSSGQTIQYRATIDSTNVITESDELNNSYVGSLVCD